VGFNGGAGIRVHFVGFSSFAEARYHHIREGMFDYDAGSQRVEWLSASYVPISVGVTFGLR
jgi:hypothetical protein